MAGRPSKLTVEYFAHFIGDGKKMFYIENKYKNDGYATWYKILETLAQTDNHFIDLSESVELMFLASKCNISESLLIEIIEDIVKLGEFDSDLWKIRVIWCQKFIDHVQTAYIKRSNECITRGQLIKILVGSKRLVLEKQPEPERQKEEKTKRPKAAEIDFKKPLIEAGATEQLANDWIAVRAKRKQLNTQTALNIFLKQVELSKRDINDVLTDCVAGSWISFKASWSVNNQTTTKKTHVNSGDGVDWDKV